MKRRTVKLFKSLSLCIAILAMFFMLFGCSGSDGAAGAAGAKGDTGPSGTVNPSDVTDAVDSAMVLASIEPEQCAICHKNAGSEHQDYYDAAWQDAVISVADITYAYAAGVTTVTFKMTKSGSAFSVKDADNSAIYWVEYTGTTFEMAARRSIKGTLSYNSTTGVSTSTYSTVDLGDLSAKNGLIVIYGRDEDLSTTNIGASRVRMTKYPFAGIKVIGTVGYTSAANVSGCEKCHTVPYFKHGYIYGEAGAKGAGKDFYTCKVCHLDNGSGGHYEWQLTVENPERLAALEAQAAAGGGEIGTYMTAAEKTTYAYKTNLKNDVHMSHAMEFPYPQSMSNCVVCHASKLTATLSDANFKIETCKSCHAVSGSSTMGTVATALNTVIPHGWTDATVCATCHTAGPTGIAPVFSAIHSGYDKKIYAAADVKYSSIFKITINSATLTGTDLKIKFTATKTDPTSATTLAVTSITPKVIIGLHGYNTKDYIVDAHGSDFDDNGDGVIKTRNCGTACDYRNLEYDWGTANPRFTGATAANGVWEVTAKLANWSSKITDKTIKRIEIGVLPALKNADGDNVPIDSPAKTFDIATGAFVNYFSSIVKVSTGCDNCHGALGVTFHSAQYGNAGVVGCRFCHTTRSGGSHLEMQSRSIDSYVHAIHSFQPFDIQNIDFADPVQKMEYELHIEFLYPTFLIQNCKSCHNTGTFDVPDQTKSLGGTLSAARTLKGKTRSIGAVPSYVTGPGSRACGSCHRTKMINEDAAGELASFNQHVKKFGYLTDTLTFDEVIAKVMSFF